jgi:hypothetical protein
VRRRARIGLAAGHRHDGRAAAVCGRLRRRRFRPGGSYSAARLRPPRSPRWSLAWQGLARGSATVVLAAGGAGDLFDDIAPLRRLRDHPLMLWLSAALACGGAVTLFEWHAERSLAEGLQRGAFEAVALSIGFAVLGRAIGARR